MFQEVRQLSELILVGMRRHMKQDPGMTRELWQGFMPRRREIPNKLSEDLYSVQVFKSGEPWMKAGWATEFDKWAAMAVSLEENIPEGMEVLRVPAGSYAVFAHRGGPQNAEKSFRYIMYEWLPDSGYALDDRPHFEIMDENYDRSDPETIEWIYIPVK